jgi:hypothetical protein
MKTLKRIFLLASMFAVACFAQSTVTVTFTGFQPSVLTDILLHWMDQHGTIIGATTASLDNTTTSVSVTLSQSSLSSAPAMPTVGKSVLCDTGTSQEPMLVASVSGLTLGLTRNTVPGITMYAHASGVTCSILNYSTPWVMMQNEAVRPWINGVIQRLGARSAVLAGNATGTVQ